MSTLSSETAATACPDCQQATALYETVNIGTPRLVYTSGTTVHRYVCQACHFLAWGADAMRANGEATSTDVPESWRASARKYTQRRRA
jgi:hypothetical protein